MAFKSTLSSKWVGATVKQIDAAVAEISTVIDTRAKTLAPKDSGNLVNSGRIERIKSGSYRITFGGGRVPYALRRHYENFKNPQTLGYLEKAGDSVSRGSLSKYLRKP